MATETLEVPLIVLDAFSQMQVTVNIETARLSANAVKVAEQISGKDGWKLDLRQKLFVREVPDEPKADASDPAG